MGTKNSVHSPIQGPLNIWTEHSNFQLYIRGTQNPLYLYWYPIFSWSSYMKLVFYAFFMPLLYLSFTQTSQILKFIQKCPCLWSLKNKFQWTQKVFWPLIRKILIWTFWDYKSSWSKKPTPIQPRGVIGAPYYVFSKNAILGSVPFISSGVLVL